jgi:hypothetical protein
VAHFKDLILIFALTRGHYSPADFKNWVESLKILTDEDWIQMATRRYVEWKHYSDAAKQQLLRTGLLIKFKSGRFIVPTQKLHEVLTYAHDFIELLHSPLDKETPITHSCP